MGQYIIILFEIIAILHLSYQVYFIIGLLKISPTAHRSDKDVTIVVAARNEFENLKKLVPALFAQKYPRYEVIIAINNSSDASFDYLSSLKDKYPSLKIVNIDHIPEHINSKKYALTLAIKAAQYETILLTDADCVPDSENWIQRMADGFEKGKQIVIGFSPYISESGFLNKLIRFETLFSGIQYISAASNKHAYMGVGRNLAYSKKLFLDHNGFNGFLKVTGGDDDLFVNKWATENNTAVILDKESSVLSIPQRTYAGYFKQKVRHVSVAKYYSKKSKFFLGIYSFTHISLWILFAGMLIFLPSNFLYSLTFITAYLPFLVAFEILKRKSGVNFSMPLTIIIDFVYLFFYIFVGMRILFTKRIEWTR